MDFKNEDHSFLLQFELLYESINNTNIDTTSGTEY